MSELPKGWVKASIADVTIPFASIDPTKTPKQEFRYADIGSIDNKTQAITDPKSFLGRDAPSRARRLIRTGDTLFSTVRTYLKNIALVPEDLDGELTSTGIAVLRPSGAVDAGYLFRWACSDDFVAPLSGAQDGTMYPAVSDRDVAVAPVPLPPLPEQRRIVAKIDSLSAKSRRASDHLDHIPRLVEKYKQAILAAAFRGELTREWRKTSATTVHPFERVAMERAQLQQASQQRLHPCDIPAVPNGSEPFDVPLDWVWVRAEAVCGFITKGTTPQSAMMSTSAGEIPFIKVYNLTFDGTLDFTVEPTFVSRTTHDGFLARSKVIPGDVLMNIVGPPLGKVSVVPDVRPEWNINQAIAVFRPIASVSSTFLSKWLLTDVLTRWAVSKSKATAGQSNLTLEICRNLPIPLCSLAEQEEIVRRITTAFNWIDRLASEAASARKLIDHLDQAVLAKAFRGELVPQDPNDEPASVLLERIRAGRATSGPVKRSGRGKQKAPANA